jgi:hypothetical protein
MNNQPQENSTMKKITIVTAAAVVAVATAGTATAGTRHTALSAGSDNRMTLVEWYNVPEGESQYNVQAPYSDTGPTGCDCVGTKIRDWVGSDLHERKWVQYTDSDTLSSIIQYRLTSDGVWHTDKVKYLVEDSEAKPFYYDVPTPF